RGEGPGRGGGDPVGVGGRISPGDAAAAHTHRERRRHAGDRITELILHNHCRGDGDRGSHRGRLCVTGIDRQLRRDTGGAGGSERDGTASSGGREGGVGGGRGGERAGRRGGDLGRVARLSVRWGETAVG